MRLLTASLLASFLVAPTTAAAQSIIRADYRLVRTDVNTGEVTFSEEGTHYFSTSGDGRYRLDSIVSGERLTEIVRPDLGRRFSANHTFRVAEHGEINSSRGRAPSLARRSGAIPSFVPNAFLPTGGPAPSEGETIVGEGLGSRQIGLLVARGFSFNMEDRLVNYWWLTPLDMPGLRQPVLLERTTVDGPERVEMVVTSMSREDEAPGLFDLPDGYEIRQMPRWRRQR